MKYIGNFPITYTCGTQLSLQDLFVGWGNSSGSNACSAATTCDLTPHSVQYPITPGGPPIVVVTPLSANFSYAGSCPSSQTAQTYSFDTTGTNGGTVPYPSNAFSWTIVNKTTSVQVGTLTGAKPTFNFSPYGTGVYTVTLTVTDDNPTAVSTISKDITVTSCCNLPTTVLSVTQPTCANSNGTVTVTTPTGADYMLSLIHI